jgi:integrase
MSLRHRDREEAVRWARRQVAKLTGGNEGMERSPTLSRVLGLYLKYQTPTKATSAQQADHRRATMWVRTLGPGKDLNRLSMAEWQNFIAARRSGAIDCFGLPVESDKRQPVRDGSIDADLVFLTGVLNWATRWREQGAYLMTENPARGFPVPHEKNPRRAVASEERFQKVRAVAEQVRMVRGRGKNAREQQTYLPEVLDLCWHTGRRIAAVLSLQYDDLRLTDGADGAILWPARSDKMGKAWLVPMNVETRAAIDAVLRSRPGIGAAFLFPSFTNEGERVPTDLVSKWLRAAEVLAGVQKQSGTLFHAYRRGWATIRKHLPDVDVAAMGGWSELTCLKTCYQQPDMATMLQVVNASTRLARSR